MSEDIKINETIRHKYQPINKKQSMKEILRSVSVDQLDVEQQTELMYQDDTIWTAVFKADRNTIEKLIEKDPEIINLRGAVGECPIHMLFLYETEEHLSIARDLIERFPEIVTQIYNKPIYYGENILHIAIVKRNPTMVEWLLSNEHLESYREDLLNATATGEFFQIGKPSYYGETPLGFACCTNQWDIVEILLKYGANMDITDSNGNTILHMLVICSLPNIYEKYKAHWIEQNQIKENQSTNLLWNRLNNDNLTPLTLAADLHRTHMFNWLLEERRKIQWSYGDVVCFLHPLDQLDLGFVDHMKERKNRPLSVLEVIIEKNDSKLVHPILTSLIDKKWKHFVYRQFIRRLLIAFVYLLIFLITTILEQTNKNSDKFLCKICCKIGQTIVIVGACIKSMKEINEMSTMGFIKYLTTTGAIFLENFLASSFCICIFLVQIFRLFEIPYDTVILAIASLLGWTYMFFFIMPFRFTGPFVIMIYKMLFNDVLRFCIIYMIFLAGFSQAFFILFHQDGFNGYIASIRQCFLGLLGDFDIDIYITGPHPLASVVLLIFYVLVVSILLLNLLIAMMGDTYADVKKSAKQLWHLERARIALDVENSMSTRRRKLSINKYWVDVRGERYLQVEQVNNQLYQTKNEETDEDD